MNGDDLAALLSDASRLSVVTPDPDRSARTQARCRALIATRARPARQSPPAETHRVIATLLVGAISTLYLLAIAYDVLRLYSVPRG